MVKSPDPIPKGFKPDFNSMLWLSLARLHTVYGARLVFLSGICSRL